MVESALSLSSQFTGTPLNNQTAKQSGFFSKSVKILNNTKKQIIQIQHKRIKKAGGNQLAIYKHGRGFELRTTKNKSSKWPERDLNPGLPDCKSNTLTTQPCCLLNCPSTTPSCSDITKKKIELYWVKQRTCYVNVQVRKFHSAHYPIQCCFMNLRSSLQY